MDVTPQLIEQIYFTEKFRGYDQDEVDDFLERVGATIAQLEIRVREATERAERAEAAAASAPASRASMTDEEEAAESTRTLMMARRTADAAIGDARSEAQRIVEEAQSAAAAMNSQARGEADRLVGEARVKADEMLKEATQRAEEEYGSRRDDMLKAIGELENRKQVHAGDINQLESRLTEYRDGLERVSASIRQALDDPDSLRQREPVELAVPLVETSPLHNDVEPEPEPEPVEPAVEPVAESAVEEPETPIHSDLAEPEGDYLDEVQASHGWGAPSTGASDHHGIESYDSGLGAEHSAAEEGEWSAGSWSQLGIDTSVEAEPSFDSYAGGTPVNAFDQSGFNVPAGDAPNFEHSTSGYDQQPPAFDQTPVADPASGTYDPYGGFAVPETPEPTFGFHEPAPEAAPFDNTGFEFVGFAEPAGDPAFTGPHTETYNDRFSRDLDEAVNQPQIESHDPVAAFFEPDDERQKSRFRRK